MADTVSIAALRQEIWRKQVFEDRQDLLFFSNNRMMGEDEDNIVQILPDLKKTTGDRVTVGLVGKISGSPILGDSTGEGNETALNSYAESVEIDQARFLVRTTGKLDDQKSVINFLEQGRKQVAVAQAEFLENQIFMKLGGVTTTTLTRATNNGTSVYSAEATFSNTPNVVPPADEAAGVGDRYLCADSAGLDSLAATDVFTADLITRAKIKAMLANPRIAPLRIKGKEYYVMFLHPNQVYDLRHSSSSIWDQAQRDAQVRGDENPIFSGALGLYNGVLLYEHEYVPTAQATAAFSVGGTAVPAGVQAYRSLLCGKQAALMVETANSNVMVHEQFDYKQKNGVDLNFIGGIQKPTFNSLDYGVIAVDTGSTLGN